MPPSNDDSRAPRAALQDARTLRVPHQEARTLRVPHQEAPALRVPQQAALGVANLDDQRVAAVLERDALSEQSLCRVYRVGREQQATLDSHEDHQGSTGAAPDARDTQVDVDLW